MAPRSGAARCELADSVRQYRTALEQVVHVSSEQRRVLTDVGQCRTAVLGGHVDVCQGCGYEHPSYNSCRNRHCPKCQGLAQQKWIEQQRQRLLDVPHFHVVFTLPAELRPIAAFAPEVVFGLLFSCAAATLTAFGQSRLHAAVGATVVLHTWDKQLRFHPHVHAIVTGGGKRPDGTWASAHQRFLFPVKAMSCVFRGKMRTALRGAYRDHRFQGFDDFADPEAFDRLLRTVGKKDWYVYAKRSFDRAKHVVEYLGCYTHRVALSNSRLLSVSSDRVVIRTRGDGRAAMSCVELLRRFCRHVLPKGFHKIRHFGLYSGRNCNINACPPTSSCPSSLNYAEALRRLTGRDITCCIRCGALVVPRPLPAARSPPRRDQ